MRFAKTSSHPWLIYFLANCETMTHSREFEDCAIFHGQVERLIVLTDLQRGQKILKSDCKGMKERKAVPSTDFFMY